MPTWNYLQIQILPEDHLLSPMIGPGHLTYDDAHTEITSILNRSAGLKPDLFAPALATWLHGAKDDTVIAGPFVYALYQHDDLNPRKAATVWLEDFAATMRSTGLDVQIAALPDTPTS
ncbi:hypothetical protein [Amycolatopsis sp. NPDC004378]